jgi:hypothetical protein
MASPESESFGHMAASALPKPPLLKLTLLALLLRLPPWLPPWLPFALLPPLPCARWRASKTPSSTEPAPTP